MDYEADEYDRPINPTGLFGGGGFGQRIFFKQNQYIAGVIDDLEITHNKGPENFINSDTKDDEPDDPEDSDVYTDTDDEVDVDPLETFLAALNLTEYWPVFKKEQIDLEGIKFLLNYFLIGAFTLVLQLVKLKLFHKPLFV